MATDDTGSPAANMRKILEAFAAKDIESMQAMIHDDVVDDFVALGVLEGREAVASFFSGLMAAIPDMQLTIHRIVGYDERVAFGQWSYSGTFTGGAFQGIEPTGSRVELRGIDVMEFDNGRLSRNTIYYDGLGFARQIGLLPEQGSAAERAMAASFNALTRARNGFRRTRERIKARASNDA